jgi:MtN3 and saliva related transmembrane protein
MLFHVHARKRRSRQDLEPYPARSPWLRFLDKVIFIPGVVGPIATIPQIINIYGTQSAGNVSAFTFGVYALFNLVWILYGLAHRERPIIIAYCLWFTVNTIVATGALIYSG